MTAAKIMLNPLTITTLSATMTRLDSLPDRRCDTTSLHKRYSVKNLVTILAYGETDSLSNSSLCGCGFIFSLPHHLRILAGRGFLLWLSMPFLLIFLKLNYGPFPFELHESY